jgi:O-antigen ligase
MAVVESPGRRPLDLPVPANTRRRVTPFSWLLFLAVFAVLIPRESAGIDSPSPGLIYEQAFGDFRWIDLLIFGALGFMIAVRIGTGKLFKLHVPRDIGRWALLLSAAIALSMVHGSLAGGTELFFDWQGLAVGAAFMFLVYQLVRTRPEAVRVAAFALIAVLAARAVYALAMFFSGSSGVTLQGVRIPVFDGPTLSNTVFVLIAAGCLAVGWKTGSVNSRLVCAGAAAIALLLVVLAFRRTYWGEAFVGLVAILLIFNKRRLSALLTIVALAVVLLPYLPGEFRLRAASANPFADDKNRYTVTNEDHLNDLRDAWDVIKQDPVLGYGLGRPYETERITNWKFTSWGVHNAILHVWLRYGLLGLISYVALHLVVLRWLHRLSRRFPSDSFERWWLIAAFSYVTATFVVSLFASPWPFGATQNSLLILGMIGTAFALQNQAPVADERAGARPVRPGRRTPRLA